MAIDGTVVTITVCDGYYVVVDEVFTKTLASNTKTGAISRT